MSLNKTTLELETKAVLDQKPNPIVVSWVPVLVLDGEPIEIHKLLGLSVSRDYAESYGDVTELELAVSEGVYNSVIEPNKERLWCQLTKEYMLDEEWQGDESTDLPKNKVWTYRATLIDEGNSAISGVDGQDDQEVMDSLSVVTIRFQLQQPLLEYLRLVSVGGLFRKARTADVIQYFLDSESEKASLKTGQVLIGTDVFPASNSRVKANVIVPHGMNLMELPGYIQKHAGGVYSTGLGFYLQGERWYVYPKFDVTRFDYSRKTITVINVPSNRLNSVDRTYLVDETGLNVTIIATGETESIDDSEYKQMNQGNGVMYTDASRIIGGFGKAAGNRYPVSRSDNVSRFVGKPKASGLNFTPMSPRRITANSFHEMSEISDRFGEIVEMEWQHADPDLIVPGEGVRFYYTRGDRIIEMKGTVLGMQSIYALSKGGITARRHVSNVMLTLYLQEV